MISIEPLEDECGVEVIDQIERRRYQLFLSDPVTPTSVDVDSFVFPVDDGSRFETSSITLPTVPIVYVRDDRGEILAEIEQFTTQTFPHGAYSLELCTPIKLYLRVESSIALRADVERTEITFGEQTDVLLGARSKHERPAATVVTTDDPVDLMAAISTFGSALKTTSPERSYPTLRGHPPLIELGDELEIPDALDSPETGVSIEVPPDLESVYVVASLAHYLGAEVRPGPEPRIVTDTGFVHPLESGRGFEGECERVLKQTFFLDCVTRTEGIYKLDLHERGEIEECVDLDFASLYDASLADQLEAYLDVPFDAVRPYVPEWKLTTHVSPTPTSVETLPFLVNDLAVIHTPTENAAVSAGPELAAVSGFLRDADSFTRSAGDAVMNGHSYVQPETTDSLEHAWIGDETPLGASKAMAEAYRNHLNRTPSTGAIGITVVCNDPEMDEERDLIGPVYGSREQLPFDVTIHRDLTRDEMATVLGRDSDFLHYIGHIDAEGIQCADGKLDASELETVGVDSFFLNACESYEQGMDLIEAGAIGGIATLENVINVGAVEIGGTIARLLNVGFPLRPALEIAKETNVIGNQYLVIGDGGLAITQAESVTPYLCEIERDGDKYTLSIRTFTSTLDGMGSLFKPYLDHNNEYFLNSGNIDTFEVDRDELVTFLELEDVPVKLGTDLCWSGELRMENF